MLASAFQVFIERLDRARGEDDLRAAMSIVTGTLGSTGFAYVTSSDRSDQLPRYVTTYPTAWVQRYVDRRYDQTDPVLARSRDNPMPFLWGDRTGGPCTSRDHPQLFDEARQFGITCGFSVPIHGARGRLAAVTFASDVKPESFARAINAHQYTLHLAAMYFDIHAKQKLRVAIAGTHPRLSRSELACLRWTASGKNPREIADILRVSPIDVAAHLMAAQRKLDAATLVQAVAEAFKHNLIDFF